ncbi:Protein SnodProt1 [Cladobotryum mycophilum]|uniref:Protein SnodProt1 n=1 Tax=Cladobotryum mycophilum TaxID=491253 RepID=A0ABR0SJG8_9HYPO
MQFSNIFAVAAALVGATQATYVSFDTGYDNAARPLTDVSCSDGPNGLIPRYNWHTQGDALRYAYIGGVQGVTWNSPLCGTCYKLEYGGRSINVIAVDAAYNGGFNIGLNGLNALTNGNGVAWGHVDAVATALPAGSCGY